MFKKITLISGLCLSVSSFASCLTDYQANLAQTQKSLKESNNDDIRMQGLGISAGLGLITTSTATGGSMAVSSTVAGQLVAALYVGKKYIDIRTDSSIKELQKNESKLIDAISLLNEAKVNSGPILSGAMAQVVQEVSPDISMGDLARKIVDLNKNNSFCENGKINSVSGILAQAIDGLK
jgi:hypothetical protein